MKKIILLTLVLSILKIGIAQNITVSPTTFNENDEITITLTGVTWNPSDVYLWAWYFDINDNFVGNSPVTGNNFDSSPAAAQFTNQGAGVYTYTFTPSTFYNATGIGRIGIIGKSQDGSSQTSDFLFEVGDFQATLNTPAENSFTILPSGGNLNISASNTNGNASYKLFANETEITAAANSSTTNFSYTDTGIISNKNYDLEVTQAGTTITKSFSVVVNPGTNNESVPANLDLGINYDPSDATKATLVIDAPLKDFVYVAGTFNDWQPNSDYAMKRDGDRFWVEIENLVPGEIYTYQYWVVDETPIANAPTLVKTSDPFSTVVLSPFDDPFIPITSYPNLPAYPTGQEREVTLLQTDQEYNWQVENFIPPVEEDLIVYEVLIRDFDAGRNYQDLIDRIGYFKSLNINAIELMPVMEFEGNESWGYNTAFHMALDKYYGTEAKFKEFIDLCHQNGIAVILDIALNHAYGRNPMVRMWMDDPDGDGWGGPNTENPYFNTTPRHSYSVGSDFNHDSQFTKDYTKRVIKHWIEDFKIDGFRWDLTKGFTQVCTGSNEGCTNAYQQDRVDILKEYADYSWLLDPEHYVIFEHLGTANEEKEWANYRLNEGKGVMMWGKMTDPYSQLLMSFSDNSNINGIGHKSRTQFSGPRVIGYPESHDEERIMYRATQFGDNTNASHNVRELDVALSRMSAIGAFSLLVPGPKMVWHFADLGMDDSIWTCSDGVTVNVGDDGCKLATKPQPQWTENWLGDNDRSQIYADWARMINIKINEAVFEGDYTISSGNLTPRIDIFDTSIPTSELRNVVVLANFDNIVRNVDTNFPISGTWYDLMDNTGNSTFSGFNITLQPGEFKIFGNQPSTLNVENFSSEASFSIYPNPANNSFKTNKEISKLEIFDITGKLVKSFEGNSSQNEDYNISDLSKGVYLIKIQDKNKATSTSKLIKI